MMWVLIRRLGVAILMSTHNIGLYEEVSKIISKLSSNSHFICSDFLENTISSLIKVGTVKRVLSNHSKDDKK